jgi:hypothetical protein
MHVAYCESFGISLATLEQTTGSAPCAAYARYILDVGAQGDILDLYVAVASCLIGYGEVGLWLQKEVKAGRGNKEGNLYAKWMEDYSGKEYLDAVDRGIGMFKVRVVLTGRKSRKAHCGGSAKSGEARAFDQDMAGVREAGAGLLGNGSEAVMRCM